MKKSLDQFISSATSRTVSYLADEIGIAPKDVCHYSKEIEKLRLRDITALIALSGGIEIYLVFSFDTPVIEKICKLYTQDLGLEDDEIEEYIEETAGDMTNLIAGNILAELDSEKKVTMTPPLYISGEKKIGKAKGAEFCMTDFCFQEGKISLILIGPRQFFDDQLEYKG